MAIFVAIVIAAIAIAAVAFPVLRNVRARPEATPEDGPSRLQELLDRRDSLIGSLRDLENDHGLGNVTEGEYQALRSDYELQAVEALKSLGARTDGIAEEVEAEVAALRVHLSDGTEPKSS